MNFTTSRITLSLMHYFYSAETMIEVILHYETHWYLNQAMARNTLNLRLSFKLYIQNNKLCKCYVHFPGLTFRELPDEVGTYLNVIIILNILCQETPVIC